MTRILTMIVRQRVRLFNSIFAVANRLLKFVYRYIDVVHFWLEPTGLLSLENRLRIRFRTRIVPLEKTFCLPIFKNEQKKEFACYSKPYQSFTP